MDEGESDKGMRWKIQNCCDDQVRAADRRQPGERGKTNFKARWRTGEVLMKKSNVWMKPRETHSVKESVGGSWSIIGQMRVAAIEMGGTIRAKIFCGFCCEYFDVFVKKRRE